MQSEEGLFEQAVRTGFTVESGWWVKDDTGGETNGCRAKGRGATFTPNARAADIPTGALGTRKGSPGASWPDAAPG